MAETDFDIIYNHVIQKLKDLDPGLSYHCVEHTLDVVKHAERVASDESINEKEMYLLKIAALYHDTGFLKTYKDHEQVSCEIFLEDCKQFNFTEEEKQTIIDLIMATRMPQKPKNLLQKIICDADLDYLGRHDFSTIAEKLKQEFLNYQLISDNNEWRSLQIKFLKSHEYHTNSSKQLRDPVKKENLNNI
jgi:uncharacterized protein